jgi:ribonucleotide monophosphatase NagD (HAD superfamily)
VTAALAKVSGVDPIIVGKSSEAALEAVRDRLGMPTEELVVIGDDVTMDIALGNLGGAHTILVTSGISGSIDLGSLPADQRPDEVVGGVAALLDRL